MTGAQPNAALAFGLLEWCGTRALPERLLSAGGTGIGDDARAFLRSREIDSLYTLATGGSDPWQVAYDLVWARQLETVRDTIENLVGTGIRVLVFKGGALLPRYYPGHGLGFTADVDLLVERDSLETAKAALYGAGFRHAWFDKEQRAMVDRDVRDIAQIELRHYELAPFTKAIPLEGSPALEAVAREFDEQPLCDSPTGPVLVVEVDLHHNVASDIESEMFFDRAVPNALGVGETFCAADHIWFNLSRYYNEVALHDKKSLRPLAYTIPVIAGGEVDWDVVVEVANELALGPTLWYHLALCDRIAPGHVPRDALAAVKRSTPSRIRDWGWQVAKLFDFDEEFPEYAFAPEPAANSRPRLSADATR